MANREFSVFTFTAPNDTDQCAQEFCELFEDFDLHIANDGNSRIIYGGEDSTNGFYFSGSNGVLACFTYINGSKSGFAININTIYYIINDDKTGVMFSPNSAEMRTGIFTTINSLNIEGTAFLGIYANNNMQIYGEGNSTAWFSANMVNNLRAMALSPIIPGGESTSVLKDLYCETVGEQFTAASLKFVEMNNEDYLICSSCGNTAQRPVFHLGHS